MEIALIADASIPALGSIGSVGWAILAVGAIAVLGYTAYEAGVFDWLGNKLDELGNIIQNEFDKVVEKAKSVWEEVDIPGKIEGIGEWLKDHLLLSKKKTGSQPVEEPKSEDKEKYKQPVSGKGKSKKSGKEKADDIPDWAKGKRPKKGQSGKEFAEELCNDRFGKGNYKKGPGTDFNRIRKYGDRGFE